jgi:hypothetical protein
MRKRIRRRKAPPKNKANRKRADLQPLPPETEELLRQVQESMNARRRAYLDHLASIAHLPPLPRAEGWLEYTAREPDERGDEEALIYFRSRGRDCKREIDRMIELWRAEEKHVFERAAASALYHSADTGESGVVGALTFGETAQVRTQPTWVPRAFWSRGRHYDWTMDATMLRAVEWCQVGGFNDWWERLARNEYEDALRESVDPVMVSYWLFAMSRSAFARRILARSLVRYVEAVEFPTRGNDPWTQVYYGEGLPRIVAHLGYAANLAFASRMIRGIDADASLLTRAAETLAKHQRPDGSWAIWAHDDQPSFTTTATAIHALAGSKARGADRAVERASDWIWANQTADGCWRDTGESDPVFATVLALDAIELAHGGTRTTITGTDAVVAQPGNGKRKRFAVALSFPGELRRRVAPMANLLASELGPGRVFYDDFHKSELARPNLDTHLQQIYHDESTLVVVFLCADYKRKDWCGLEWRAIRDLIKKREDESIMFVRSDSAEVPGSFSIDGYIDLNTHSNEEIAKLIVTRLKTIRS